MVVAIKCIDMSTRVLLVRHAQTFGNIEGRFCGHSETELTPLGIAQARALGLRLAAEKIDGAVCSDLSRARLTAEAVLESHGDIVPAFDAGLREMYYGEWEAMLGTDVRALHPELMRSFFLGGIEGAPGGESIAEVRTRTAAAMLRAAELHRNGTVLIVSHGNAIMAMLAEVLGLPLERTWAFSIENTSVSRLLVTSKGHVTIQSLNDAAHIHGLAEATIPRPFEFGQESVTTSAVTA